MNTVEITFWVTLIGIFSIGFVVRQWLIRREVERFRKMKKFCNNCRYGISSNAHKCRKPTAIHYTYNEIEYEYKDIKAVKNANNDCPDFDYYVQPFRPDF